MAKFNFVRGTSLSVICILMIVLISLQMNFLNIHIHRVLEINKIEWTYILEYFIALACGILAIVSFVEYAGNKNKKIIKEVKTAPAE